MRHSSMACVRAKIARATVSAKHACAETNMQTHNPPTVKNLDNCWEKTRAAIGSESKFVSHKLGDTTMAMFLHPILVTSTFSTGRAIRSSSHKKILRLCASSFAKSSFSGSSGNFVSAQCAIAATPIWFNNPPGRSRNHCFTKLAKT